MSGHRERGRKGKQRAKGKSMNIIPWYNSSFPYTTPSNTLLCMGLQILPQIDLYIFCNEGGVLQLFLKPRILSIA
jgi:hypothetical protein